MSTVAGQLHWNRQRITLQAGVTNVDTELTLTSLAYPTDQPSLGVAQATPPSDNLVASRVMVLPMAPLATWADVVHGEPYLDTDTNTVHVEFDNDTKAPVEINVLFWNPHTIVSPGDADTYNAPQLG